MDTNTKKPVQSVKPAKVPLKFTLTVEDVDVEEGKVNIAFEFDPPVGDLPPTTAQYIASRMLDLLTELKNEA